MQKYFTPLDIALEKQVSPDVVRYDIRQGRLASELIAGRHVVSPADAEAYIKATKAKEAENAR